MRHTFTHAPNEPDRQCLRHLNKSERVETAFCGLDLVFVAEERKQREVHEQESDITLHLHVRRPLWVVTDRVKPGV